jgi:hypothetical protein
VRLIDNGLGKAIDKEMVSQKDVSLSMASSPWTSFRGGATLSRNIIVPLFAKAVS